MAAPTIDVCVRPIGRRWADAHGRAPALASLAPDRSAVAFRTDGGARPPALCLTGLDENASVLEVPAPGDGDGDAWADARWLLHEADGGAAWPALAALSQRGRLRIAFFDGPVALCLATFGAFRAVPLQWAGGHAAAGAGGVRPALASFAKPTQAGEYVDVDLTTLAAALALPAGGTDGAAGWTLLGAATDGVVLAYARRYAVTLELRGRSSAAVIVSAVTLDVDAVVRRAAPTHGGLGHLSYAAATLFALCEDGRCSTGVAWPARGGRHEVVLTDAACVG